VFATGPLAGPERMFDRPDPIALQALFFAAAACGGSGKKEMKGARFWRQKRLHPPDKPAGAVLATGPHVRTSRRESLATGPHVRTSRRESCCSDSIPRDIPHTDIVRGAKKRFLAPFLFCAPSLR
jgi:hypothetical protein